MEMEGNLCSRTFGDLSHVALGKFVRVHQFSGCYYCEAFGLNGDGRQSALNVAIFLLIQLILKKALNGFVPPGWTVPPLANDDRHCLTNCCVEMAQQGDVANFRRSVQPGPQSTAICCSGANPVTNGIGRDWLGRQF
jgi:hypothetical protein